MKPASTFFKLFLDHLLVMAVVIALAGMFTYRQFDANYQKEARQNQERLVRAATEHFRALCGIKPEDRPRVFERFYQGDAARSGDNRTRGTGLGLAIVKHAAERLGARVDLQSRLGNGTTVTVFLG